MKEYITREAAISALTEHLGDISARAALAAECVIHKIPAAPVREVKPGHWIWVTDGNGKLYNNMFECSECHVTQIGHPRVGNFCPNCGADMRAKEGEAT